MMWGRRCVHGSIRKSLPRTCKKHGVCVKDVEKGEGDRGIATPINDGYWKPMKTARKPLLLNCR